MTLRRLLYHYRSSRQQICIQWEVVRRYWALQWRYLDPGPALVSPALPRALKAPLSSQAKAVTRLWQLPQTAKMRSSTICGGSSVTYRRGGEVSGPEYKKSIALSSPSTELKPRSAMPPRLRTQRWMILAQIHERPSTCFARC